MQAGHHLEFSCPHCEQTIGFSVIKRPLTARIITCSYCNKEYAFNHEALHHLHLFEALCRQIHESQAILGQACVAVDVAQQQVKIPFNLLLTRLNCLLEITIGATKIAIHFRVNPVQEIDHLNSNR